MPAPLTVAVAPFALLTSKADARRLMDGLRSGMLSALARRPNLQVLAETFDPTRPEAQTDAAYDGTVVYISVAPAPPDLHVLLAVEKDGAALGAVTLELAWSDAALIPERLADAAAALLLGEPPPAPRIAPLSQAAYERYLLARHHAQRFTPADSDAAIDHFRTVLAEAPDYAPALSGLAAATFQQLRYGALGARHAGAARESAQRAVAVDAENVEAHVVLALVAFYHDRDAQTAADAFRDALALDRDRVTVLREAAWFYLALGHDATALEAADRALDYDPLSVDLLCLRADLSRYTHDPETARTFYRRARALDVRYTRAIEGVASASAMLGDRDAAYAALDLYRRSEPNRYWRHRLAGEIAVAFGDDALYQASLDALRSYARDHPEANLSSDLATLLASRQPELALTHLAEAVENGVGIASVLRYPAFDPLRSLDGYRDLVAAFDLDVEPPPLAPPRTRLVTLESEGADALTIPEHAFLYATAAGNYAFVQYLAGGERTERLIRAKLANLEAQLVRQLGEGAVMRVHRSALVRLDAGVRLEGTARTARLVLDRFGVELAVSRSAFPRLRERLGGEA